MAVNHKIVYVPIGKDARGIDLIYPIYAPIVVDDPKTVYATGKLSKEDYLSTLKLYHLNQDMINRACGSNEVGGFPFAPLIAALAPIAIPPLITAAKKIFGKSKGMYDEEEDEVEEELNSDVYDDINKDIIKEDIVEDIVKDDIDPSSVNSSGYIPTNPNIRNLRQLQSLYEHYK